MPIDSRLAACTILADGPCGATGMTTEQEGTGGGGLAMSKPARRGSSMALRQGTGDTEASLSTAGSAVE
jgi:hypothetical protein